MVTMISGKHMDVGSALQQYVHERVDMGVRRALDNITQAKIVFSKKHHIYHADVVIHDSQIGHIKAESESDDAYVAFDTAIIKIEKQLRKYKNKLKKHHHDRSLKEDEALSATKYVLNVPLLESLHNYQEHDHEPVTIAETQVSIETLTVSEAIMKMDLAHLPALMFINKINGKINMVYHRQDGNISWVDPKVGVNFL